MIAGGAVDLSIVIVNYRSWARLERGLASLRPLLEAGQPVTQIIVVDNASGDGSLDAFASAHAGVSFAVNDGNWGFADGCNLGAREARGAHLLFFNPDAEDRSGAIAALLAAASAHPEAAILTARQVDDRGRAQKVFDSFPSLLTLFGPVRTVLRTLAPRRFPDPRKDRRGYVEVDWVSGSALLIRRPVFEALGGFCSDFWMYSEDVDLCRRARDAGHAVAVVADATLLHAHGGTSRRDPETAALTRSEVVVSRHLYANRHFGVVHAGVYHLALAATRFVPLAPAALLAGAWRGAPGAVRVRAATWRHLARYYLGIPSRGWRSPRARPVPQNTSPMTKRTPQMPSPKR